MNENTHDQAERIDNSPTSTPTADTHDSSTRSAAVVNRRRVLNASGVAMVGTLAGCIGAEGNNDEENGGESNGSEEGSFDSFVETDGTDFVVDGDIAYFNGANNFWITDDDADEATEERVDQVFSLFDDLGVTLVRMWAHGEAKDGELTLQPEPGEHNEESLQHHDYVIETAKDHGIRVIVALVDNWDHEGGMLQYTEWTGGETRHHFYTDQAARDLYKNHVETIVTRENSISGVEYRNDPTIMMWELANEPRLERDDTAGDDFEGDEHRDILGEWFADMSEYVKSLDDNHLVSTGSEGHYYNADAEYPNDQWDGQDFITHHEIDTIDACSFHLYPDHWPGLELDDGTEYICNRMQDAHGEIVKPAYLGEFNVNIDNGLDTKHDYLTEWYDAADEHDCNAVVPWQIVLAETENHDGFQLYEEDSGYIVEDFAETADSKSDSGL